MNSLLLVSYGVISHRMRQKQQRAKAALFDLPPDDPAPNLRLPDPTPEIQSRQDAPW